MLVRILYASRAVGPQTSTVTASILAVAQEHNRRNGITGILCQGQGLYLQVIEGERSAINQLYARIQRDRRHNDVEMLSFAEIADRRFPDWSMAHVDLSDMDPIVLLIGLEGFLHRIRLYYSRSNNRILFCIHPNAKCVTHS